LQVERNKTCRPQSTSPISKQHQRLSKKSRVKTKAITFDWNQANFSIAVGFAEIQVEDCCLGWEPSIYASTSGDGTKPL
jgi:hypothetical protein